MNITLNDLNLYIEAEKRKDVVQRETLPKIAMTKFCDIPAEELMATFEVCMHAKVPQWTSKPVFYQEFRQMFEDGRIDILQLTGRQRLLFLTCLSDSTFEQKMLIKAAEYEEHFIELCETLVIILLALRNGTLYTTEQVKVAHEIASLFMECNQKVLNYRRYIGFAKFVFGKEIS